MGASIQQNDTERTEETREESTPPKSRIRSEPDRNDPRVSKWLAAGKRVTEKYSDVLRALAK